MVVPTTANRKTGLAGGMDRARRKAWWQVSTEAVIVVAGVIVALAFIILVGYVVSTLSKRAPAKIAIVIIALASLFAVLPRILAALHGP
jgi:hypothetical protein